ncbi:MAG: TIGR03364 family FAD-dependent oxidoreductase [Bacteroidota bacterium]
MPAHSKHTEIAIIGGGIVGLTLAYMAARKGLGVTVFERNSQAVGASIRNFGMIWPIGQAAGKGLRRALRSRELWREASDTCGFWRIENGSLHLAYHEDEWHILQEFQEGASDKRFQVSLCSPDEVLQTYQGINPRGLKGALRSETEMIVDPREVPQKLASWLQHQANCQVLFDHPVQHMEDGRLATNGEEWMFDQAFICCGSDFETLYPQVFLGSALIKSKLQMLRTFPQAGGWRVGASLCAGLTLAHYASFADCPSLPALKARIQEESPQFFDWGIHVMVSQNGKGELVLGDSHEYAKSFDPFIREEVNTYIMDYLRTFFQGPDMRIMERWYGVYAKNPHGIDFIKYVSPKNTLVTGVGGAGMTHSFGLAEELIQKL